MAHPETEASTIAEGIVENDPIKRIQATLEGPEDDLSAEPGDDPESDQGEGEPEGEPDANEPETGEDPASPAIEPPVSWKPELKEFFQTLPPEKQAELAAWESERNKSFQVKANEAAEARKSREQAEAAIHQLHGAYTAQLEQFLSTNEPAKPDPAWLDTRVYGDDGPRTFYQMQAAYEAHQAQRTQAQQELQTAQQRQAALSEHQTKAFLSEQHQILAGPEGIPGWGEPSTQAELSKTIATFANAHGYAEQLAHADAQDIKFLHQAMGWREKADKYDALQKSKMAVVRQARELPKTARPNAPQPPGSAQARVNQQSRERLKQSGDLRDAAALIANRL